RSGRAPRTEPLGERSDAEGRAALVAAPADLPLADHDVAVLAASYLWLAPHARRVRLRDLADLARERSGRLRLRASVLRQRLLQAARRALGARVLLSHAERRSAPALGCRLRLRAAADSQDRLDRDRARAARVRAVHFARHLLRILR